MATRIQQLSQPKRNHLRHPDRRSVYWLDKLPPEWTGSTTKIELTPRWSDLCRSKKFYTQITFCLKLLGGLQLSSRVICATSRHNDFTPALHRLLSRAGKKYQQRVSPIWEVSEWALRAVPSKRVCDLAQPRAHAAGWQTDRPLLAPLSRASLTAVASSRICKLAQARRGQAQEGSSRKSKTPPIAHLASKASAHIELLASPKHEHPKFEGERSVYWPVSRAARNYIASPRLHDLSSPKERKALFEGYDPYTVSRAARSASPSPRIKELCLPLPRKCSSK